MAKSAQSRANKMIKQAEGLEKLAVAKAKLKQAKNKLAKAQ
jgi:hypothetical protein